MSSKKTVSFHLPVISMNDNIIPVQRRVTRKKIELKRELSPRNDEEILFYYPQFPQLIPTETSIKRVKQRHLNHCWVCSSIYSDCDRKMKKHDIPKLIESWKGHQTLTNPTSLPTVVTKLSNSRENKIWYEPLRRILQLEKITHGPNKWKKKNRK